MVKQAFYFPHFVSARNDLKVQRLRKDLGIEGYAIFFLLLEVLREQSDFVYPWEDVDLLAKDFETSVAKIQTVITSYKLFEIVQNDEGRVFFSPKQIIYLQPMLQRREQNKLNAKKSALAKKIKIEEQILELSELHSSKQKEAGAKLSVVHSRTQRKERKKEINKEIAVLETTENELFYVQNCDVKKIDRFFTKVKKPS